MSWAEDVLFRWIEVDDENLGMLWTGAAEPDFSGEPEITFPREWAPEILAVVQPHRPEDIDRNGTVWEEDCDCLPVGHDDYVDSDSEGHLDWLCIGNRDGHPILTWQGCQAPFSARAAIRDADLLTLQIFAAAVIQAA
ncbi:MULTISPECIES: hypothetical protein [unclassified Nocardioides]|uniref:hypothetical protein n=1 Tax=unclassified Nocardioides TaxID=2615069 RepID=UPI0030156573